MDNFGLYLHSLIKKETKEIIRKIDAKNYFQMRKSRSQGLEVASDYTQKLRCAVRKSKTQKLTFLEQKNLRKRLITQQNDRLCKGFVTEKEIKDVVQEDEEQLPKVALKSSEKHYFQQLDEKDQTQGDFSQTSKGQTFILQKASNQQQYQLDKKENQAQFEKTNQIAMQHSGNKNFLPMLSLYIQQQRSLATLNAHEMQIRSLIVTMMVLAINRRKNGGLLDALDVLLQSEVYFPKENQEMVRLKSVWLELIGKIYQQIKKSFKNSKGKSRWKRTTHKTSMSFLQAKRQKTIFIRSLASRKAFFDKFSETMRKSMLIFETTFLTELGNQQNKVKVSEQGDKFITRIDKQTCITFPQPKIAYPHVEGIEDYAIIVVSKDKQANIFPLNYPNSLAGFINKQDYLHSIVKMNSYLVPCTRCMNYQSSLFIYFQLILAIFLVIFVVSLVLIHGLNKLSTIVIMATIIILTIMFSYQINRKGKEGLYQIGQTPQLLEKHCKEWEQQYESLQIKFTLNNDLDIFLITFPVDQQLPSEGSSNVLDPQSNAILTKYQSFKEESRKCSIRLANFQNPIDQINEYNSDDQEDKNEQFWRKAEYNAQNSRQNIFNEAFDLKISEQSSDYVIKSKPDDSSPLQVQLIPIFPHQQS